MSVTYNIYRSDTPMDIENMPVALATGLTTKNYSDTAVVKGQQYYYRVGAEKSGLEKISDEIKAGRLPYKTVILADSPIAYYPLDELSGSAALDVSDNPVNGTIYNCVLGQAALAPALGTCYYFNGSSSRIELGSPSKFLTSGAVSMECWVSMDVVTGNTMQINYNFGLRMQMTENVTAIIFGGAFKMASTALAANTLYHIVFVCTSTGLKIYINGVLNKSGAGGGWAGIGSSANSAIGYAGVGRGEYFKGYISNVALYDYELSAAQVLAHYNAGIAA